MARMSQEPLGAVFLCGSKIADRRNILLSTCKNYRTLVSHPLLSPVPVDDYYRIFIALDRFGPLNLKDERC